MVNSGSSANLLMVSAVTNPHRSVHLNRDDVVLVPAVCWSTSLAPLLQLGLKPAFVDVSPMTFNADIDSMEAIMSAAPPTSSYPASPPRAHAVQGCSPLSARPRAMMVVHVLGNSTEMARLVEFARRHDLILIEDTCESLGSTAIVPKETGGAEERRMLGTFGDFGSFSFYFSHHITSGEGGMVVCKTEQDYNFLRCLRAHGWTRHLTNRDEVEGLHPDIDSRFLFVNIGYNLRPMEVQGAMLLVQLRKLAQFNATRRDNLARIKAALDKDPRFSQRMSLMAAAEGTDPAWFGIGVVLHRAFSHQLRGYLKYLGDHGVENRPLISGNFVRQPLVSSFMPDAVPEDFPGADVLHSRGFFIGVHQIRVSDADIGKLVEVMLGFQFRASRFVLVTGSNGILGRYVRAEVAKMDRFGRSPAAPATHDAGPEREVTQTGEQLTEWIFCTREDADLADSATVNRLFKRFQPTHVLHLAASLQSLNEMSLRPVDFWLENVRVNNNVLETAFRFQSWVGPTKVVSVLSAVTFPTEGTCQQAASGSLHTAEESYSLATHALAKLSAWYRTQHAASFVTVLPGNFFGAHGDFAPATAPLLNALIAEADAAGKQGQPSLKVVGTGRSQHQVMHASDLARIMIWSLERYDEEEPLTVAGPKHSIAEIAQVVCKVTGFQGDLSFDTDAVDGPLKVTADTSEFRRLLPEFEFTPLREGIQETVAWYRAALAE
jgi:dTDP-4-amino-4,6-dideoxygalactose transaminase/nucleoside-diphosphate-sugar epimerase